MCTHHKHTPHTSSHGFSTIELLIAFSVGIIFLTAAMMVSFSDPTLTRQIALDSGQAAALDATLDNTALATSTNSLGNIVARLTANWNATITGNSQDPYTTTPNVTNIAPCLKEVVQQTTWTTLGSRDRHMTFGTALGDMDIARQLGRGGCDPLPASNWDSPESDNLAQTNVAGADAGTDIAVRSFDGVRYAFVTSNPPGGGGTKKEFTVIDVSDNVIQSGDVRATINADKGLLGLIVVGTYAYVLNNDTVNQLQIINVTDPDAPTKLPTSYTLPNITCSYHVQNCQRTPRSIAYYGGYLYIGTGYMAGNSPEFHVYCISDTSVAGCSPTTPVARGSLNLNHNINDIAVQDNYAYLATSADYGELTVVDVTSKAALSAPPQYTDAGVNNRKFNSISTQGNPSTEDAWSVFVLGTHLYLGREKVNNQHEREFSILDISTPTAITEIGSLSFGMTNNDARISDIVVQGNTAFAATLDSNKSLYVIDVTQATNPHLRNTCSDFDSSNRGSGLEFKDNRAYLVHNQGSSLLKIIYDAGNACTP